MNTTKLAENQTVVKSIARSLGWEDGEDFEPYLQRISSLTPVECFEKYLQWQGIIGYSSQIWNAVEVIKNSAQ